MTTGDFNGDRIDDVAIGMPRGAGLLGKIVVNGWNMVNIFNITGRQIGEYFGYALASCDVDGDGLDDLIIGAPMYSEPGNAEGKYDVGRIYVLLQTSTDEVIRLKYASSSFSLFVVDDLQFSVIERRIVGLWNIYATVTIPKDVSVSP